MEFNTIRLSFEDKVAYLTLNRPDKLNSFTAEMHREVKQALDMIGEHGTRAMVLTGAGRAFCAGQDLGDPEFDLSDDLDIGKTLEENYNPLLTTLKNFPFPVIAAVNGVAAGAGANIALACDLVLAAKSATFIQAFAKIGLIPDAGGTWTLTRKAGPARAMGLAMLAEPLSAQKACDWGLIWQVCDDDSLLEDARQMAKNLACQPTRALAAIKQAINAASGNDFDTQLALERDLQRQSGKTYDFREGVRAFMEKRKPVFRGE